MKDRIVYEAVGRNTFRLKLDDEVLFEIIESRCWTYIYKDGDIIIRESLPRFESSNSNFFLEDIIEQLENGVDRNKLKMNIPKFVETIKIGDKVITVERYER